ncbi:hypothetical protein DNTS_031619 [Danionella cerebrum]|uniref:Uncharacterized protein n=1 Tax=Danionella cerebrum TaxID=2873325 RepID=A0A553QJP8_9TELE|nr:hypothetical protein DNTS_031619 [Danionella translucida]
MSVVGQEALIPHARSRLPLICASVLGAITLALSWYLDSDQFTERAGKIALCMIFERFLVSVCLFVEEWLFHSKQRYNGRMGLIFHACFRKHIVLGMVVIFLVLMLSKVSFSMEQWSREVLTCAVYLLLSTLGVLSHSPVEISEIYLQEKVKEYSYSMERLNSSRLHILLPLNARVPKTPEEEDQNVVFLNNLPELSLNRAGVHKRSYKNSVYRIEHNNETWTCVLEYATPLLTLYQMSQDSSAGFGEPERKQQVLLFYRTLSQILENSLECRNRYRLILLDDEHVEDSHYLSKVLAHHLRQQDGEIDMFPVQEQETDSPAVFEVQEDMFSQPSLMISLPLSLHSGPMETTDNFNLTNNRRIR